MKRYRHIWYLATIFGFTIVAEQNDVVTSAAGIEIEKKAEIELVEDEIVVSDKAAEADDAVLPNDPLFAQQWSSHNDNGFSIDAPRAWTKTRGDRKIAIAILDTGIDVTHPDLKNNLWTNPGEIADNGKDDDNNGYVDDVHGINAITGTGNPMDDNGHGTHVAGIIGAEGGNGIGIAGVMHEVSLIPCKFLDAKGNGTTESAVRCMDYIADLASRDTGVTIIATNNAWGGGAYSDELYDAILEHRDLGILFITDAGASAKNIDDAPYYPASYNSSNIIVVGKADSTGALTKASNFGPSTVHVAAPGFELISTSLNGTYNILSGSSATGFISGIVGLLSAQNSELTYAQLKHRLLANTTPMIKDASKLISGGFVNAANSLVE